MTTAPSETQNSIREEYAQGAFFPLNFRGDARHFFRKVLLRLIQNNASHRGREAFFVNKCTKLRKGGCPGRDSSKKRQTAGVMHNLTAAMHRNIFAVGLLDGKSTHGTSDNAIIDLHMERKKAKRTNKGAIAAKKVTSMALLALARK